MATDYAMTMEMVIWIIVLIRASVTMTSLFIQRIRVALKTSIRQTGFVTITK